MTPTSNAPHRRPSRCRPTPSYLVFDCYGGSPRRTRHTYFDAAGGAELAASIAMAVSAPFRVYGPEGETLATGTVGAQPVELDPGSYRVEILTEPPIVFEQVELGNGESVTLELPAAEG